MFRTIHSITVRNPSNFTRRLVGSGEYCSWGGHTTGVPTIPLSRRPFSTAKTSPARRDRAFKQPLQRNIEVVDQSPQVGHQARPFGVRPSQAPGACGCCGGGSGIGSAM